MSRGYGVRLRLHATGPDGRQSMVYTMDVSLFVGAVPVGGVVAWCKSASGTPGLADNWEECDGHTCEKEESPFYGSALPNLNGAGGEAQRFLRGAGASGGVGGEDAHVLTVPELAAHSHAEHVGDGGSGSLTALAAGSHAAYGSGGAGSGVAHENRPAFYEVVWIVRVY
jgi:hypothetical protein